MRHLIPLRVRSDSLSAMLLSMVALGVGAFTLLGYSANAPQIKEHFDLTETGVGAIAAFGYLGAMSASRLGGSAADRRGPRFVIAVGLIVLASGAVTAAMAPSIALFYVGVMISGLGYGTLNPATTVLSNPVTARHRGLMMSLKQSGVPLGGVAAGAAIPTLGVLVGWRLALIAPVLASLSMAMFMLAQRSPAPRRGGARPTVFGHDRRLARWRCCPRVLVRSC